MSLCDFAVTEAGPGLFRHSCRRCGRVRVLRQPLWQTECPSPVVAQNLTLGGRLVTYAEAVTRWIAHGRPERDAAAVKQIYTEHCRPCEHFAADQCRLCGCNCREGGAALTNKLRMATEACPVGKWS